MAGVNQIPVGDVVETHQFIDRSAKALGDFRKRIAALHRVSRAAAGRAGANDEAVSLVNAVPVGDVVEAHQFVHRGAKAFGNFRKRIAALDGVGLRGGGQVGGRGQRRHGGLRVAFIRLGGDEYSVGKAVQTGAAGNAFGAADGVLPAAPTLPFAVCRRAAARQPQGIARGDLRAPKVLGPGRVRIDGRALAHFALHSLQESQGDGVGGGRRQAGEVVEIHCRAHLHFPIADCSGEKAGLLAGLFRGAGGKHVVKAHEQSVFAGGYVIGVQIGVGVIACDAGADVDRLAAAFAHLCKVDIPGAGAHVQSCIAGFSQRGQRCIGHEKSHSFPAWYGDGAHGVHFFAGTGTKRQRSASK